MTVITSEEFSINVRYHSLDCSTSRSAHVLISALASSSSCELNSSERCSVSRSASNCKYASSTVVMNSCQASGTAAEEQWRLSWRSSRLCMDYLSPRVVIVIVWLCSSHLAEGVNGEISPYE